MNTESAGSRTLSKTEEFTRVDLSTFDRVRLRGGRFAPSWLHFWFYLICRRHEKYRNTFFGPPMPAWNAIGANLAIPYGLLLLTVSQYVPFLDVVARQSHGLETVGGSYDEWAFWLYIFVGLVALFGSMYFLFGKQYRLIMLKYSVYGHARHAVVPTIALTIIGIGLSAISCIIVMTDVCCSPKILWPGALAVLGAYIVTEVCFRWWWRRWCTRNGQRQESGS